MKHSNILKHILDFLSLSWFITTDCFSQAGPSGPPGMEAELWQTWALEDVLADVYACSGCGTSAENRRLLWSTSLPQGALGMPVLELPRTVTKLSFLL